MKTSHPSARGPAHDRSRSFSRTVRGVCRVFYEPRVPAFRAFRRGARRVVGRAASRDGDVAPDGVASGEALDGVLRVPESRALVVRRREPGAAGSALGRAGSGERRAARVRGRRHVGEEVGAEVFRPGLLSRSDGQEPGRGASARVGAVLAGAGAVARARAVAPAALVLLSVRGVAVCAAQGVRARLAVPDQGRTGGVAARPHRRGGTQDSSCRGQSLREGGVGAARGGDAGEPSSLERRAARVAGAAPARSTRGAAQARGANGGTSGRDAATCACSSTARR